MSPTAETLLAAILELPDNQRTLLAEALMESLPPQGLPFDPDWMEEIRRRSAELDAGLVDTIPWSEVRGRARETAGG